MTELLSLIVPIYNAEPFLTACLDSLLNQTYKNIEIILVNDGSTDSSGNICQEYAKKNSCIVTVNQSNSGNTAARRTGITAARGSYISFVDSDDWIDSSMYEVLIHKLIDSNSDIISSGYIKEYPNDNSSVVIDSIPPGIYNEAHKDYIISNMIYFQNSMYSGITRSLWTKIYKKEILLPIMVQMDNQIQFGEDAACVYSYLLRAKSIVITDDVFYHYRIHDNSIMHQKDDQYLTKINHLFLYMRTELERFGYSNLIRTQLNCFLFENLLRANDYMMDLKVDEGLPFYVFPASHCPKGSRLIIYGAGEVGQAYYKSIIHNPDYTLAAWTDKNYAHHQDAGRNVTDIHTAVTSDFDYILLAVKYPLLAEEIRKSLSALNIPENKILWFSPRTILESYL